MAKKKIEYSKNKRIIFRTVKFLEELGAKRLIKSFKDNGGSFLLIVDDILDVALESEHALDTFLSEVTNATYEELNELDYDEYLDLIDRFFEDIRLFQQVYLLFNKRNK